MNFSNTFKIKVAKFQTSITHPKFVQIFRKITKRTRVNPVVWPVIVPILRTFFNKISFYFFCNRSIVFTPNNFVSYHKLIKVCFLCSGVVHVSVVVSCLCCCLKITLIQTIRLSYPCIGDSSRTKLKGYFVLIISI